MTHSEFIEKLDKEFAKKRKAFISDMNTRVTDEYPRYKTFQEWSDYFWDDFFSDPETLED